MLKVLSIITILDGSDRMLIFNRKLNIGNKRNFSIIRCIISIIIIACRYKQYDSQQ